MSIESVMPSKHLILSCPLLLLPSIFPSIRVFSNESVLRIRRPKYWSFSFNISPSNEYSRLISFKIYWLDLLAVQGTLKNLLQHHSSKASILRHSAFLIVQLSHPYMTNWLARTLSAKKKKIIRFSVSQYLKITVSFNQRVMHLIFKSVTSLLYIQRLYQNYTWLSVRWVTSWLDSHQWFCDITVGNRIFENW